MQAHKVQQHMYNKQAHVKGDTAQYATMSAQTTNICVNIRRLLTTAQLSPQIKQHTLISTEDFLHSLRTSTQANSRFRFT